MIYHTPGLINSFPMFYLYETTLFGGYYITLLVIQMSWQANVKLIELEISIKKQNRYLGV